LPTGYGITNKEDKPIAMTFRIDKEILEKIRIESKNKGISINTFVNQIIKSYAEWYIFEPKIGMIPLPKTIIAELFKDLTKEEVSHIATSVGKRAIYDIALFMKSKVDIDTFLQWFESRMKNSSMHISHNVHNHSHIYTLKHDICINWSFFYKVMLESIFKEIFGKSVDIGISEGSLTIIFER
jgi:hypothetical protein